MLIGYFYDRLQAEQALDELKRGGFRDDQIGVALCDFDRTAILVPPLPESHSRVGAVLGGLLGALAGGLLVWLFLRWIGLLVEASWPLLGALLALLLGGVATGIGLGLLVGTAIDDRFRPARPAPEERTIHLSRGVVTVRPEGRDAAASAILCRYAGCDAAPAPVV